MKQEEMLIKKLIEKNSFWSYDLSKEREEIPDDFLIEKTLIYLDIEDINLLFNVFSLKKIKKVWKENMIPQDEYYHSLNRLLAWMYFDIKNPNAYLNRIQNIHYKQLI